VTNERWDGDETGSGVSDGAAFAPPLRGLLEEMGRPDWNAEDPEAHLLPHLERWLEDHGSELTLEAVRDDDGVLVLDLDGLSRDRHEMRGSVYRLIATIAEPTTTIVEREEPDARVFEVVLALQPWQGSFPKGHGHLVRFSVRERR
jgi:hypothetical protein